MLSVIDIMKKLKKIRFTMKYITYMNINLIHVQRFSAKEFGMGIATKSERPNLKVVSDFVHLHVFMSPGQWNLKMSLL